MTTKPKPGSALAVLLRRADYITITYDKGEDGEEEKKIVHGQGIFRFGGRGEFLSTLDTGSGQEIRIGTDKRLVQTLFVAPSDQDPPLRLFSWVSVENETIENLSPEKESKLCGMTLAKDLYRVVYFDKSFEEVVQILHCEDYPRYFKYLTSQGCLVSSDSPLVPTGVALFVWKSDTEEKE